MQNAANVCKMELPTNRGPWHIAGRRVCGEDRRVYRLVDVCQRRSSAGAGGLGPQEGGELALKLVESCHRRIDGVRLVDERLQVRQCLVD